LFTLHFTFKLSDTFGDKRKGVERVYICLLYISRFNIPFLPFLQLLDIVGSLFVDI